MILYIGGRPFERTFRIFGGTKSAHAKYVDTNKLGLKAYFAPIPQVVSDRNLIHSHTKLDHLGRFYKLEYIKQQADNHNYFTYRRRPGGGPGALAPAIEHRRGAQTHPGTDLGMSTIEGSIELWRGPDKTILRS
ncbi:hypothetical protein PCH_Pc12g01680 [Penicillium rubens Wisconsin 54-1255]|uniref:Uncharacterized protein n=1 Tax=Penicillium rubens (strain ATCC 28089 / DSM 1075 / NRRL 1951 / Wisconsin 54-1255) TaxID=500485 RepID=B6GZ41_PENRW|nr:hypothetical protein PCH_Pc12g01680 [Penicillium rubens Wisconsin 54-1255]